MPQTWHHSNGMNIFSSRHTRVSSQEKMVMGQRLSLRPPVWPFVQDCKILEQSPKMQHCSATSSHIIRLRRPLYPPGLSSCHLSGLSRHPTHAQLIGIPAAHVNGRQRSHAHHIPDSLPHNSARRLDQPHMCSCQGTTPHGQAALQLRNSKLSDRALPETM